MIDFQAAVKLAVRGFQGETLSMEDFWKLQTFISATYHKKVFEKAVAKQIEIASREGCVKLVKSRSTGRVVGLYKAAEAGMESDPETPWATVCEDHGGVACHPSRAAAEAYLSKTDEWCPGCQGDLGPGQEPV